LRRILELLSSRRPRSLRIAALLKKRLAENADLRVDFLGFEIGPSSSSATGSISTRGSATSLRGVWKPEKRS